MARQGKAWRGRARRGKARQGKDSIVDSAGNHKGDKGYGKEKACWQLETKDNFVRFF
jgi:hypothetical protein